MSARRNVAFVVLTLGLATTGCAGIAVNAAADAISGTGSIFASDDDPELIADAAPFGLKTMEGLLEQTPEHKGLLLALTSGYAQYGYAFMAQEADRLSEDEYETSELYASRAAKHYRRARGYGRRLLEARHERFFERLASEPDALFEELNAGDDVSALYWTAAAWALAIGASDLAPEEIADFPLVEQLARWALALDEDWDDGTLHTFMVTLEAIRPGGDLKAAEKHFERALVLDGGRRVGTYLSFAEGVCVRRQDVVRFHQLLEKALAVDEEAHPDERLANVIMKRRARRLLEREEDLFLVPLEEALTSSAASSQ